MTCASLTRPGSTHTISREGREEEGREKKRGGGGRERDHFEINETKMEEERDTIRALLKEGEGRGGGGPWYSESPKSPIFWAL
jgi:hypothetical protein